MDKWDFTDIHAHIIFGVDDGSDSLKTSLKLIEMEYKDGIRDIIATPHFGVRNMEYDPKLAEANFKILQDEVGKSYHDLKLYQGNEIFILPGFADGLSDGMSKTLNGTKYVLIEFPFEADFGLIYHEIRRILVAGYIPILAHAERYINAYKNVKGLTELKNQGCLIQINSDTIADIKIKNGKTHGRFDKLIYELLTRDLVDFVATDIHALPGRQPRMSEAKILPVFIWRDRI